MTRTEYEHSSFTVGMCEQSIKISVLAMRLKGSTVRRSTLYSTFHICPAQENNSNS